MILSRYPFFGFSNYYHPCKFVLQPELIRKHHCKLGIYVDSYRQYGHLFAKLDPLELYNQYKMLIRRPIQDFVRPPELGITYQSKLSEYKFSSPITQASQNVEELENKLREAYLGTTGVQFNHIINCQEKQWLYSKYESLKFSRLSDEIRIRMATTLVEAEALDHFLHKKWSNFKRYSGQGAQSTIVALDELFNLCSQAGYEYLIFGMPHRGRFNTLINVLNYEAKYLFRKIAGKTDTPLELRNVIDDVTSHVAHSIEKQYGDKKIQVSLVHNPSHLQAQNPVAMGKTRSKILFYGKDKVINVQVHGDAAVCAQGIVSESLCLSKTPNFDINGSIHIITNNQIGYTTKPIDSRPSKYATDLFKAYDVPILHVNGQNIEDVYKAVLLAVEYQSKFKKDILIDIICYRKYGHNQVDEPEFTQPFMYQSIRKTHEPNTKKYARQLAEEKLISPAFYEETRAAKFNLYQIQFAEAQKIQKITLDDYINPKSAGSPRAFTKQWSSMKPSQFGQEKSTAIQISQLKELCKSSCFVPNNFALHPRIKKIHIQKRLKMLQDNKFDWATCEDLAFFSLISEGYNIRFTGQDVERGTFSQRHINLVDQKTEEEFNPLNYFASLKPGRGNSEIHNSALTENAVVSYQYGYSIDHPNNFSIWEAQFGDFYTPAQVVADVFLSNSENKWLRQSSLTLLLPHGLDAFGPDHSSSRIERFLDYANSDGSLKYYKKLTEDKGQRLSLTDPVFIENIKDANLSVTFPSTPANFFHLLRRQMRRNFRKPLVVATPKLLLRHPECISKLEDMGPGSSFRPVLKFMNADKIASCSTVFLASGKILYEIQSLMQSQPSSNTCLLSIQQLFPFPEELLQSYLQGLSASSKVYWVQQQHFNEGPYQFVENRINRVLTTLGVTSPVHYVGRRAIAGSAVGSIEMHKEEVKELTAWIKDLIV